MLTMWSDRGSILGDSPVGFVKMGLRNGGSVHGHVPREEEYVLVARALQNAEGGIELRQEETCFLRLGREQSEHGQHVIGKYRRGHVPCHFSGQVRGSR